jgi:hypothetical protein
MRRAHEIKVAEENLLKEERIGFSAHGRRVRGGESRRN